MVLFIPWLSWPMFLLLLLLVYFVYMCWHFRHFSRQGIPIDATPLPCFGTALPLIKKGVIEASKGHLQTLGQTYGGYACRFPVLTTIDFDILKEVFIRDTETFPSRNRLVSGDPMSDNMLSNIVEYDKWKSMRSIMSPTFSSGKLKRMMPQINNCAKVMMGYLQQAADKGESVEMKEYAGHYTMDVIASTAFGLELDSTKDENSDFVKYAKMAFEVNMKHPVFLLIIFFPFLLPLMPYFKIRMMKKEISDFFTNVTNQVLEAREEDDGRVDFLRLMMNAHKDEVEGEAATNKMSKQDLLSQSLMFFLAGYDTTATTVGFLAHSLTVNPEAQDKLMEEIEQVMGERDLITDEDVQNMPYLEMCVNESLRMYPPAAFTERCANKEVTLKGINMPKYGFVRAPIHQMHYHPDIYPDPETYKPERFSSEEKAKRNPLAFMPFGAGPRQCIATRLAMTEVKIAIVHMLRKYRLVRAPETEDPIQLGGVGLLKAKNGIWLKLEERHPQ